MTDSAKGIGAITLFVSDLAAARAFYGDVLGRRLIFEDDDSAAFDFGAVIVNLLRIGAAGELVEPAPVAAPEGTVRCLLTIDVDDVDAACERLVERGVVLLNGPIDRPWGVRTAAFRDPAGHAWELAAPLSRR